MTFFSLNCTSGVWYDFFSFFFISSFSHEIIYHNREEILLTVVESGFLITIPIEQEENNECEEEVTCVSGSSLAQVEDPDGCEVGSFLNTSQKTSR